MYRRIGATMVACFFFMFELPFGVCTYLGVPKDGWMDGRSPRGC